MTFVLQNHEPMGASPGPRPGVYIMNRQGFEAQRDAWREELDSYYATMRSFSEGELAQILSQLSAMSARASEIRGQLSRGDSRQANAFVSREVEPFLAEVDRQFKIWSRYQAVLSFEWEMERG